MSIFSEDQNEEFTPEVTIPEGQTAFDNLVGDGKKFKDPEALAKSKLEADAYIEYLKKKVAEKDQDLNTRLSLEQFAEQMRTAGQAPVVPDEVVPPNAEDRGKGINPAELESLLEQMLAKKEQKRAVETNLEKVDRVLREKYGDQAKTVLSKKSSEIGLSVADLKDIAAKNPDAFFRLAGVDATEVTPPVAPRVPTSSVNSLASNQHGGGVRGHSYYENLKRKDPKLYNSPQIMSQQFKDMKALGLEEYYNK